MVKWANLGALGLWGRQGVENVYEKSVQRGMPVTIIITTILFWQLCGLKTQFPTFCVFVLRGVEKKTHKHSVVGTNRKAW